MATKYFVTEDDWNASIEDQIECCRSMLTGKAHEYARDKSGKIRDRLHNFNTAAEITGRNPLQAAGGMMVKHTTSVYDMIERSGDEPVTEKQHLVWIEKLTDHINYLLIARAIVDAMYQEEKARGE